MEKKKTQKGNDSGKTQKKSYSQKFRQEWKTEPLLKDWLREVPGDTGKARCAKCGSCLVAKHSDLLAHVTSKRHETAVGAAASSRKTDKMLPKDAGKSNEIEGALCLFVACHCAIRSIDHLGNLCNKQFSPENVKIHRSKCSGILQNIMAPHFEKKLLDDIGDGPYSILIDESTDISVTKVLGIVVVYFSSRDSEGKLITTFLELAELPAGDADCIVSAVKVTLQNKGLSLNQLRGIGVDNASVNTGIHNGVHAKLSKDCPGLIMIRCVCHSLQLAVSSATASLPCNLDFLVRETYTWFSHSFQRQSTYKSLYRAINDGHDPKKIVQACQTRWLSIETALSRILDQWLELKTMFQISKQKDRDYTAGLLYEMYSDLKNKAFLLFLKPTLKDVQRVNKSFEAQNADPCQLLDDLATLINSVAKKFVLPTCREDFLVANLESYIHWRCYLGFEVEELLHELKLPAEEDTEFRRRCITFLVNLHRELQSRLPTNIDVLRKVSCISVSKALRVVKEPLIPIMKLLGFPSEKITLAQMQWQDLTNVKWTETANTLDFWNEVNNYRDASGENPFQHLVDVAMSLLVLPWSNAEVERVFSMLAIVKTDLRNRMGTKMVNALLTTRSGLRRYGKCCHDYELPPEVLRKIGTMAAYAGDSNVKKNPEDPDDPDDIMFLDD